MLSIYRVRYFSDVSLHDVFGITPVDREKHVFGTLDKAMEIANRKVPSLREQHGNNAGWEIRDYTGGEWIGPGEA